RARGAGPGGRALTERLGAARRTGTPPRPGLPARGARLAVVGGERLLASLGSGGRDGLGFGSSRAPCTRGCRRSAVGAAGGATHPGACRRVGGRGLRGAVRLTGGVAAGPAER